MNERQIIRRSNQVIRKRVLFVARIPNASEVVVTGDFTNWSEEGIRLSQDCQGEWSVVLNLDPGEYQYRLRVDGHWQDHPGAQKRVLNPFGTDNCILVVD